MARRTTDQGNRPKPAARRTRKPTAASRAGPAKSAQAAPAPPAPAVESEPLPPPPPIAPLQRPTGPLAIETRGLSKHFAGRAAVDGIDLRVPKGQVVGFVGPNGAGKTTTIRMLLGLIRPTGGEARVLGEPITDPTRYLPRVGALIEAPAFYAHLSAARNLLVQCRLGGHDPARIPLLLQQVGLGDRADEAYKDYSMGMKQRLGIAAALLPDPDLLILDEPTNGLDPAGIHEIRDFLRSLGDAGKTVFVSSHLLSEIQRTCDHVVMLRKGRVLFQGTVAELSARGAGLHLVPEHARDVPRLAGLCRAAGYDVDVTPDAVHVHGAARQGAAINRAAAQAGITLAEVSGGTGDLEQTFLAMTGEGDP